ncbi:MAG: alkaline phosphatase family protein [Halobacteriaceae archaeon]
MELLVVGLDGLSDNMLERFDVDFPSLEQVRETGVSGDLMSVDTPTTVPAWTSFATGLDPGSHGVHSMKRISREYEHGPVEANRSDPAIYDFLDRAIFVNLPASDGREPAGADTYVQSSLLSADKDAMTPEALRRLETYDDYVPIHDPTLKSRPDAYLEHVLEIVESREAFARDAFETYDPRVGFVLFSTTDWAGHILSKLRSDAARAEFYGTLVDEVAGATGRLGDLADNVLLMSDHGFEHKTATVHTADWLHDEGYMVERASPDANGLSERAVDAAADAAVGTAKALSRRSERLYGVFRFLHNRLMGSEVGARLQDAARPDVDYRRSTVFNLRYGCLYINDERFADPQVTGDEVETLRDELVAGLADLTDEDGDPLFREVLTPEEAYEDPIDDVPDVIPRPAPGNFPITHWSPTGGYTSPTSNYEHRYRGIVAASGPMFGTGAVEGMSIVDVLPTVMAALGEPLSPAFDGEARTDLLGDHPPVTVRDAADVPEPRVVGESAADRTDREDTVEARLADLGYME